MIISMNTHLAVTSYIKSFPAGVGEKLKSLRGLVQELAPEAVESFSYQMPAYKYKNKPLVYFAAFEKHIGLYATPSAHERFARETLKYKQGKGSIQFPLQDPLPLGLIKRMIEYKKAEIDNL